MRQLVCVLGLALAVAACSTPTFYQPAGSGTGDSARGYAEYPIEENRFRVSFSGNSLTDRDTVELYLLYRAAELTLEEGYDHFVVVDRATERETRLRSTSSSPYPYGRFPVNYHYYHPRYGWGGYYDPYWNDTTVTESTRYDAGAEIVMGRGPKPEGENLAFNAQDVIDNLSDRIIRPPET